MSRKNDRINHQECADQVSAFLACIRPLSGCCWCDDEDFHQGRSYLEQYAIAVRTDKPLELNATEIARVLHYLSSIQPMKSYSDGSERHCGYNQVLDFLQEQVQHLAKVTP